MAQATASADTTAIRRIRLFRRILTPSRGDATPASTRLLAGTGCSTGAAEGRARERGGAVRADLPAGGLHGRAVARARPRHGVATLLPVETQPAAGSVGRAPGALELVG